jgi:hypothetical protein
MHSLIFLDNVSIIISYGTSLTFNNYLMHRIYVSSLSQYAEFTVIHNLHTIIKR